MLRQVSFVSIALCLFVSSLARAQHEDEGPLKLSARFELEKGKTTGRVVLECEIPEGSHIYSVDQTSPPGPTKIKIGGSDSFKTNGPFVADRKPEIIEHDPIFEARIEQFADKVAFFAPIEVTPSADLKKLTIHLTVTCQVCSDSGCILVRNKKVDASFAGYFDPAEEEAQNEQNAAKRKASQDKNQRTTIK
jgi:DsbC/DsbD-like thiol-disulfide interchange protein